MINKIKQIFVQGGEYKKIVKNVGKVLIVMGVVDIIYMFWVVSQKGSYSSSFNIFAIIAGIFLIRGNLKAVRIISCLAGFYLVVSLVPAIVSPFLITPVDYWMILIKLNPGTVIQSFIIWIIITILLVWVYFNLTSDIVINEMKNQGPGLNGFWLRPQTFLILGVIVSIIALSFSFFMLHGNNAQLAAQKAQKQIQGEYKYFVNSVNVNTANGKKSVIAQVTAYNQNEIKNLIISW